MEGVAEEGVSSPSQLQTITPTTTNISPTSSTTVSTTPGTATSTTPVVLRKVNHVHKLER